MTQAVEVYHGLTAAEEEFKLKYLEILRERTRHDEAQAIFVAEQRGEERANAKWLTERDKWQSTLDEQAAIIAKLRAQLDNTT